MKTNEFIKKVMMFSHEIEVEYQEKDVYINIYWVDTIIASVSNYYELSFSLYDEYNEIPSKLIIPLFDLIVEYAKTPVEERSEEKKYLVKLSEESGYYLRHANRKELEFVQINSKSETYNDNGYYFTMEQIKELHLENLPRELVL